LANKIELTYKVQVVSQQPHPVFRFEGQNDNITHPLSARYTTELEKLSLPVMKSRDLVSGSRRVSRPIFSSLGLECVSGLVSVSKDCGFGLELLVSRLCMSSFFMKSCKKQLLENGIVKYLF